MQAILRLLVLPVLMVGAEAALAQSKRCTKEEASAAEDVAATLKSWPAVHDAFVRYGHCDDGAIGEGFSESVVKMLAERWPQIDELRRLITTDAGFRTFVLRHVDPTAHERDLKRVVENAAQHCPPDAKALCTELERAAQNALKEI